MGQFVPIRIDPAKLRPFDKAAASGTRNAPPNGGGTPMNNILRLYTRIREQKGQSMAEYALIMAAIAVVAMVAYTALGGNVSTLVTNVSNSL